MNITYKDKILKGETKEVDGLLAVLDVMKDCGSSRDQVHVIENSAPQNGEYFIFYNGTLSTDENEIEIDRPMGSLEEVRSFLEELWGGFSDSKPLLRIEENRNVQLGEFYFVEIHASKIMGFGKDSRNYLKERGWTEEEHKTRTLYYSQ